MKNSVAGLRVWRSGRLLSLPDYLLVLLVDHRYIPDSPTSIQRMGAARDILVSGGDMHHTLLKWAFSGDEEHFASQLQNNEIQAFQ